MIARTQQTLLGYDLSQISPELIAVIALVLVLVGLALAFAGRRVWKHAMSFIGAVIGGLLGFVFGAAIGGWILGFVAGMLGSFVGSAVFIFLARVGISLVAALLAFVVGTALFGAGAAGLVLALIAFVLTFVYAQTAIGLVTAVVGGLLVGSGMFLIGIDNMMLVLLGVLAVMVFGGAFQMIALKEEKEMRAAHHAVHHPVAAAAVAPPAPPPMPGRTCSRCGGQLTYIPEYDRYYCYHCQKYE